MNNVVVLSEWKAKKLAEANRKIIADAEAELSLLDNAIAEAEECLKRDQNRNDDID